MTTNTKYSTEIKDRPKQLEQSVLLIDRPSQYNKNYNIVKLIYLFRAYQPSIKGLLNKSRKNNEIHLYQGLLTTFVSWTLLAIRWNLQISFQNVFGCKKNHRGLQRKPVILKYYYNRLHVRHSSSTGTNG